MAKFLTMEEYINKSGPSTASDIDSYVAQWQDNLNKALLERASDLAAISSSILRRKVSVSESFDMMQALEKAPLDNDTLQISYRVPRLCVEGIAEPLPLDIFETLCAPFEMPEIIAWNEIDENDIDIYGTGIPDNRECYKKMVSVALQQYYNDKADAMLRILNGGCTDRRLRRWGKNGGHKRKVFILVDHDGGTFRLTIRIRVSRLRHKDTHEGFSFRGGVFSPYSPYIIPQVLTFVSEGVAQDSKASLETMLWDRMVSKYRYNKWLSAIHSWAVMDEQANGDSLQEGASKKEAAREFLGTFASMQEAHCFLFAHLANAPAGPFDAMLPEHIAWGNSK